MKQTIPHLLKMCNYPFSQRVLAMDPTDPSGDYLTRPHVGTVAELQQCCENLLASGSVDKLVNVDFSEDYHRRVYAKHFGRFVRRTHNFRGAPVLSYIYIIEEADSDYLVHFNTDMLMHQQPGCSWIEKGIEKLQQYDDIASVIPLPGPPSDDGLLKQRVPYERDARGFYRFKQFTSRKFLIDRKRFEQLLPLEILWKDGEPAKTSAGQQGEDVGLQDRCRELDRWEVMISHKLRQTRYFRADLDMPAAWSIHSSYSHGPKFLRHLPKIINRVESGWYPPEQAGRYNLDLELWLRSMS
jgi:hypothetical protein